MNRYHWDTSKECLTTYCERIARYWSTLPCMEEYGRGKARGQRYKAVRAFQSAIRSQVGDDAAYTAYLDTLDMSRLIKSTNQ